MVQNSKCWLQHSGQKLYEAIYFKTATYMAVFGNYITEYGKPSMADYFVTDLIATWYNEFYEMVDYKSAIGFLKFLYGGLNIFFYFLIKYLGVSEIVVIYLYMDYTYSISS